MDFHLESLFNVRIMLEVGCYGQNRGYDK